ncbi:exodeoxyribonuclease V subunit beta [Mariprofundus erugo]|uniref:RecBCD enzyme subunit RecB n=1 Tax=Mariprofundus erugo TaxID=2528639 RepID=A0A5R9GUX6_9PROT|nr:exodeoxyribonuclease V subunit beta [Mariprofundus erugo]TLS67842.1 exodeoxyribonuclease V subunit beta [Mariprofundus erugo]
MSSHMNSPMTLDSTAVLDMDFAGFKLVEASAGTGKTYTIGNLYLRMLMDGYKVSEILVVTFTNAATEELRGRIRLRIHDAMVYLEQLQAGTAASDDLFLAEWGDAFGGDFAATERAGRQLKLALNSMDEAAIYTIHGFCQRALTEHAFHSRQTFDVEMMTDDSDMWDAAIKDWWRVHAYPLDRAGLQLFTAALGSVESLVDLQKELRKPKVKLLPDSGESTADLLKAWRQLAAEWGAIGKSWGSSREQLIKALCSGALMQRKSVYKSANLEAVIAAVETCLAGEPVLNASDAFNAMRATELKAQLKKGQSEEPFNHPFFVAVDHYLDKVCGVVKQFKVAALAEVNKVAGENVSATKRAAGQLSFNDQLEFLERALADNHALGCQIHERFPIAMIDEFQDTDAIQYSIFRHIYQGRSRGGLIMIGDPKQAIYSFRGGDIFTYIQAKLDAVGHYTLGTNWRSTPGLIEAVNRIFSQRGDETFIYKEIPFSPVAAADKSHDLLHENGVPVAPMTIWHIQSDTPEKAIPKNTMGPLMHAHTANEIARLLHAGRTGALKLGEKGVEPGDIAVLVRTHFEANALKDALRARGISAVANGGEQVYASDEATGLLQLLEAVIDFRSASTLRCALASSLLNYHYSSMHALIGDEQQWLTWMEHFRELNATWAAKGFMAMFQQMLRRLDIGERIAARHDASRRLTNLLHLGELAQQASKSVIGMDALLHWFKNQMVRESSEAELRLENDGDLVRIVTIHGSKGLEYPIVFLPYMWSCRSRKSDAKTLLAFYDEQQRQHCLHADPADVHLNLAEKERLAEDIRLAYVALTRARAKVYLAWGHAGDASKSAPGWLFHHHQHPQDLAVAQPMAMGKGTDVGDDLKRLADLCGHIEVIPLPTDSEAVTLDQSDRMVDVCTVTPFTGSIAADWRISSFSGMTRDVHQLFTHSEQVRSEDPVFNFPAGSQTGLFLHALFEELDFQQDHSEPVRQFTESQAARYGLDADSVSVVDAWVADVLATPLSEAGITLGQIPHNRRLNELEFDFSAGHIDIALLNQTLEAAAGQPLQKLVMNDCRGYITGIIDLVFEANGRFYLADYKSNHLGFSLDAYAPEKLAKAVFDRRYDLQYLLYSLALHRYLRLRLPDYDYETCFGGVYYLFLRGMRADHGDKFGVYYARPEKALIDALDQQVFGRDGRNEEVVA